VGGFDTKIITEDIELTWNLLSKGYKTKMSYDALAYTSVPSTVKAWVNQRIRWNIGGLQTLKKYHNFIFRGENLFGYFVITYVSMSFVLSLLGIALLLRFFYYGISPYLFTIPYIFQGYNPFVYSHFQIYFSVLLMLGITFLTLSFIYHKIALNNSHLKKKGIVTIFEYTFLYRPLYMIPLLKSLYKMVRRDIRWYTK
jgi:cellulose synthase/poly-beta-1,6-N-acetylglucosamine synthase-like glycosyltransferase